MPAIWISSPSLTLRMLPFAVLFFLMILRPTRSTPFPYTTLFRSKLGRQPHHAIGHLGHGPREALAQKLGPVCDPPLDQEEPPVGIAPQDLGEQGIELGVELVQRLRAGVEVHPIIESEPAAPLVCLRPRRSVVIGGEGGRAD